jgi:hypothetical protein
MRDQDSFCLVEMDLFNGPARELIFRLTQTYLEQETATSTELVFNRARQRHITNEGNRLADAIQRTAALQSQQTRQPVLDRRRELNAMVSQAMRLIDSLTRQTPSDFELTGSALSRLCTETADRGFVRTAIIIAAKLAECQDWGGKIDLCLDLLESGAEAEIAALLEQTLAELLRLEPAGEAFGFGAAPCSVIDGCLAMIDPAAPPGLPLHARLRSRLLDADAVSGLGDALCDRISQALDQPGLLSAEAGFAEWPYLLNLKQRLLALPAMAEDPVLRQALGKRFLRLAQAEQLNRTLAEIPAYGRKVIYLAQLYPEVQDGLARRDLLTALTFNLEHRDFSTQFVESGTSIEDMSALAQAIEAALKHPELPEHRRDRFRASIEKLYLEIKKLAERRRDPRVMGGPNDAVCMGGQRIALRNWSTLGVLFGPVSGGFKAGDTVEISIEVHNEQIDLRFDASADIIRATDGLVAARYYCTDSAIEQRIRQYFAN